MTGEFLSRCGMTADIAIAETYQKIDVIESCIDAIDEGVNDIRVISTATSYTHSMIFEILDNVKEGLLKLAQRVLSVLNNYHLNNVRLLGKYREAVIERLGKMKDPIIQETFEYPDTKDFPKALRSTGSVDKEVQKLIAEIQDPDKPPAPEKVQNRVNQMLKSFGYEVLGLTPDPYHLKDSTAKIVRDKVRGKPVTVSIDRWTLEKYFEQISTYKRDKDDILRTRKNLVEDYELLKRSYSSATKDPNQLATNRLKTMVDPDKEAFLAHEYNRYANIHVEMMRLFNGYIAIYKSAFDTKLSELNDKINNNKNTIVEIITRTGLFASLNTKSPMNDNPIPYNPSNIV